VSALCSARGAGLFVCPCTAYSYLLHICDKFVLQCSRYTKKGGHVRTNVRKRGLVGAGEKDEEEAAGRE